MARRLSVVIAQHAMRGQAQTAIEEALVGQLIFVNGLDPSLVASLDKIAAGSTDHLFMEGIQSDFVLLHWSEPELIMQELVRIGMSGQLVTLGTAGRLPFGQGSPRRVYHVRLDTNRGAESVMESLKQLLNEINTSTVKISLGMASKPAVASAPKPIAMPIIAVNPPSEPRTAASSPSKPTALPVLPMAALHLDDDDEEAWTHLDQLVDDLDESGI